MEKEMKPTNTPYDDVFRTLLNDCASLIMPVINEMFGEHYTGEERVVFGSGEHFLNQQDGEEETRVTDSNFRILGAETKKYHMECQSSADSSMLVRFFEYDAQIALDEGEIREHVLTVTFPHSAVLFLRCTKKTPEKMKIVIQTPGTSASYEIPVMKTQRYSINEIFEKKLLFLIPFYIFTHESMLKEYNEDESKLALLKAEYEDIKNRLESLLEQQVIEEYTRRIITDMSGRVLEHLAEKYDNVKEGVKSVMGGRVLEHEAKTIRNEGIRAGRRLERQELILESLEELSSVPESLRKEIMEEEDMNKLKKWCRLAARVMSVEEFLQRYQEQ